MAGGRARGGALPQLLAACGCLLLAAAGRAGGAAAEGSGKGAAGDPAHPHEVHHLPTLEGPLPSRMYSGFLGAGTGKHLHYMFVESERDPQADPLVLWLNGGPGASSLMGFFTEFGPVIMGAGGKVIANPYSWSKEANFLFLESPTGVGFSYCDEMVNASAPCRNGDMSTAFENLAALHSFLDLFPAYKGRDFMIWGESYAGVYVPMLSHGVHEDTALDLNFLGFAAGDPCTADKYQNDAHRLGFDLGYAYRHGMLEDALYAALKACQVEDPLRESPECRTRWRQYYIATSGGDGSGPPQSPLPGAGFLDPYTAYGPNNNPFWDSVAAWLNRADVEQALNMAGTPGAPWSLFATHLDYTVEFQGCSDGDTKYNMTMIYFYNKLIGKVPRILVFSGDVDPSVQMLGTAAAVEAMDLKRAPGGGWRPWFYRTDDVPVEILKAKSPYWGLQLAAHNTGVQLGGWVRNYQGLDFVTVHDSGHMVPQYKPVAAAHLFKSALLGKALAPELPMKELEEASDAAFFGNDTTKGLMDLWVERAQGEEFVGGAKRAAAPS